MVLGAGPPQIVEAGLLVKEAKGRTPQGLGKCDALPSRLDCTTHRDSVQADTSRPILERRLAEITRMGATPMMRSLYLAGYAAGLRDAIHARKIGGRR